jgi:long-chain acyl-CoA synthetase
MNPEETEKVLLKDGFLLTGDVGYLDSENYLYLTGRKKNMIVTEGGKNVFPEEIEDYFQLYEEVEQIMVKGYLLDQRMKTEGIEAFIYPPEEFTRGKIRRPSRPASTKWSPRLTRSCTVPEDTQGQVLSEPMEMTTTKKIKRFTVQDA